MNNFANSAVLSFTIPSGEDGSATLPTTFPSPYAFVSVSCDDVTNLSGKVVEFWVAETPYGVLKPLLTPDGVKVSLSVSEVFYIPLIAVGVSAIQVRIIGSTAGGDVVFKIRGLDKGYGI